MYKRNSAVKFGKSLRKVRTLTSNQEDALTDHRLKHKEAENDPEQLNKHIKVMRDLMKGGDSFTKSHEEADKLYPMKMITFELLWALILHLTDWRTVEQDDVPPILKAVRTRHAEAIPLFAPRDRRDIFQDDNFF